MYSIELQTIFYEYQNKNPKINTSFVRPGLRPLRADKTGFNLIIFYFNIRGKLSIIRCDKYILWHSDTNPNFICDNRLGLTFLKMLHGLDRLVLNSIYPITIKISIPVIITISFCLVISRWFLAVQMTSSSRILFILISWTFTSSILSIFASTFK